MVNNNFKVVIKLDDRNGCMDSGEVGGGWRKDKKKNGLMIHAAYYTK